MRVLRTRRARGSGNRGFSLVELMLVLLVGMTLAAIALPAVQSTVAAYRFRGAVAAVSGAIHATRHAAIMRGFPHRLALDPATRSYRVSRLEPGAEEFTWAGDAVPFTAQASVVLEPETVLEFRPNGTVEAVAGGMTFSLSHGGTARTFTVSSVGNVAIE